MRFSFIRLSGLKALFYKTDRLENELVALNFGFDKLLKYIKFPRVSRPVVQYNLYLNSLKKVIVTIGIFSWIRQLIIKERLKER